MPLPRFSVSVLPRLAGTGSTITIKGTIEAPSYEVGHESYTLATGVEYDAVLTNTGDAVLVTGMAHATALTQCARCLELASFELSCEIEGYYLFNEANPVSDVADRGADEFDVLEMDGTIDLSAPITAGLIVETPAIPLCREDCQGLCPVCGANLNDGTCEHAGEAAAAHRSTPDGTLAEGASLDGVDSTDSPFAVLRNLHLIDEEDAGLDADGGDGRVSGGDSEH